MKRLLLAALAFAPLFSTTPAAANTYDVYACWAGYGTFHNPNASTAAWARDDAAAGGHFAVRDDCAFNTSNGAMSIKSVPGAPIAQNQQATLSFSAPAGMTLAGASLWRRAWSYGTGSGVGSQRSSLTTAANAAVVSTDADGSADVPVGTRGTGAATAHGIVGANLLTLNLAPRVPINASYRIGCAAAAGCPTSSSSGPDGSASGVEIYGAIVSVLDNTVPTLSLAQSGILDGTAASGVRPVVVEEATDDSGIKRLEVYADDDPTPIGTVDYEQDLNRCNWATAVPCQGVAGVEIPIDTRLLPDGDHSFVVKAYDAADNEKVSSTHYATVRNTVPSDPTPTDPPPTDPTPTDPAPPAGGGGTDGTGLPNGISSGNGGGGATTAGPKLTLAFDHNGRSTLNAKYGRMITVRGHLTDGGGAGIAGAQLDYHALSTAAGARLQNLGAVRTDNGGSFALRVATKLGSRQLRFAYRPQLGGPVAVSAEARLNVIAPVSLKVAPKHVHNRHAIVFRGRLSAGPIPRKGKLVNLQVVVDGRWHTFATIRTARSGKFKYRYRFRRTYGRVTYRFRALSRYEAAYPFVAGHSATVRVRVN